MSTTRRLVLLGAGGHAAMVAEAIALSGDVLAGHLSPHEQPDKKNDLLGPRLGDDTQLSALIASGFQLAVGIGFVNVSGARMRRDFLAELPEVALATIVHPCAIISPSADILAGAVLAAGSILGTRSRVGIAAIVNSGAIVDHDCVLGRNCHISIGAKVAGGVTIGDDVLVGAGATIRQGVSIGNRAVIGAGAVVLQDVAADTTVLGIPASPISEKQK